MKTLCRFIFMVLTAAGLSFFALLFHLSGVSTKTLDGEHTTPSHSRQFERPGGGFWPVENEPYCTSNGRAYPCPQEPLPQDKDHSYEPNGEH